MLNVIVRSVTTVACAYAGLVLGGYAYKKWVAKPVAQMPQAKVLETMLVTLREEFDASPAAKAIVMDPKHNKGFIQTALFDARYAYLAKNIKASADRLMATVEPLHFDDWVALERDLINAVAKREVTELVSPPRPVTSK